MEGLLPFKLPCRKCLPCRLNLAREKAVRAFHEAQMHDDNIFLTLTYSNEHLASQKLIYSDFQKFMKKLRKTTKEHISYMVTGEYGDKTKRPHWHAILFNYMPKDMEPYYTSDRGDQVYKSKTIDKIWAKNDPETRPNEIGSVTLDSASYVARYASKKLSHGKDQDHDYHPIHQTSCKHAIGRSWIEKYYKFTFENGFCVLPNGALTKIPRYYEDWAKEHQPELYDYYMTNIKLKAIDKAEENERKEELEYFTNLYNRFYEGSLRPITKSKVQLTILNQKFKKLQERLKL